MNKILSDAGGLAGPNPVIEVLAGTIGLVMIIIIHGAGIRIANRRFSQAWVNVNAYSDRDAVGAAFPRDLALGGADPGDGPDP